MNSNLIIERERKLIDLISYRYHYDNNIRHLLYIIIPAFIIKYGIQKENMIIDAFKNIRIIKTNENTKNIKAYYSSMPLKSNGKIITKKHMVIENYDNTNIVDLLDSLIHEFNHAINSYINEVKVSKKYIYLRTGLTYRVYKKDTLEFIKKHDSYLLEEIINTKQTSDIINIIKGFETEDSEFANTIYAINNETSEIYNSNSYFLQSSICKEIMENSTFIATLENLRLSGEVYNISSWFDTIIGKEGQYKVLIENLKEIYDLENKLHNQKLFKSFTINKIKHNVSIIQRIIKKFNDNVNFK